MAPRKTRAAAKAEDSTSPDTDILHPEDQVLEQERDDDTEQVDDQSEDMARPKSRKGGKNGAKKKAGKKPKVILTPQATTEAEAVKDTPAPVVEVEEFNPAAMPILRSPRKDVEAEPIGKCTAAMHSQPSPS